MAANFETGEEEDPAEKLRRQIYDEQAAQFAPTEATYQPQPTTGEPLESAPFTPTVTGGPQDTAPGPTTSTTSGTPKDLNYWSSQGVPQTQIFDNTTGQLRSGWQRTAEGYDRMAPAAPVYGQIQGFDYDKLTSGGGTAEKYSPAVRTFSQGLGAGTAITRGNLWPMVAYAQAQGFPNARAVGDDKIDFGDGNGPIDVIQSNGSVWFQNGADRFAPTAAAPSSAATGSGQYSTASTGGGVNPQGLHPGTGSTEAEWAISKVLSGEWTQAQADQYLGSGAGAAAGGGSAGGDLTSLVEEMLRKQLEGSEADRAAKADLDRQVRAMISQRLTAAGQPVNESDEYIAAPLSAARDETQRSQQSERTALAERLYAQGGGALDSNALTQQIQQSSERNAGNLSNLRAGLIGKELTARRGELQSLLQMALAQGDAEQARQTQLLIQQIDHSLRREFRGIDLAEFMAQLDQNAALAGLNG